MRLLFNRPGASEGRSRHPGDAATLPLLGMIPVIWMVATFGPSPAEAEEMRWWKGNLHTHTHWSDGNDYPEMIADWYKKQGYHFLAFSEHNVLAEGRKWISVAGSRGGQEAFEKYRNRFGDDWIETRRQDDDLQVRLKTLNELQPLFNEAGRFLLVRNEEISDRYENKPIHLNASNLKEVIPPQGGDSVVEVLQNNVDAVLEQSRRVERPILPHINHPNFRWALTAEEITRIEGEKFFEVYNGHPAVRNYGDDDRPSTERMWDVILANRLGKLDMEPMFGIAVDDAHNYHRISSSHSNPGRGWVVVRSRYLTPAHLIRALEAGDFYASTGVALKAIRQTDGRLTIEIDAEPGVDYKTQFIATRDGFSQDNDPEEGASERTPALDAGAIGEVVAEVEGPVATYKPDGDELYVRAKVISSKLKARPYSPGEKEVAWVQPWVLTD